VPRQETDRDLLADSVNGFTYSWALGSVSRFNGLGLVKLLACSVKLGGPGRDDLEEQEKTPRGLGE